jgi:drug/metabolite transporter (DMT)-like permease
MSEEEAEPTPPSTHGSSPSRQEILTGVAYMVFGIACFAGMDAVGKWLVESYPVFQLQALRGTMVTLGLLAATPFFGGLGVLRSPWLRPHLLRALCGGLAFLFFFTSVRYLPLADAVAVAFGGPFIVTALSVPLLGERVDARRWLAITVGFVGMLLIVRPTGQAFRPAALLVIAASCCYALLMILTRWMHQRTKGTEPTFTFVFYAFAVQTVMGWLGAPFGWRSMTPSAIGLMVLMGLLALAGQAGITLAFRYAPVSVAAPFEYTALVWATILGFVVFGELPEPGVWLGVVIIVVAGLYTIHREGVEHRSDPATSEL